MDIKSIFRPMLEATERMAGRGGFELPWIKAEHMQRYLFAKNYVNGKIVVDCACGAGIGSRIFAEAGATRVYGFDVSDEALERARLGAGIPTLSFSKASGLQIPLEASSVDLYVSLETIEHIVEDGGFLAEARRLLKPEGTFICSTPNRTVTNPGTSLSDKPWNKFHVREYNKDEFLGLLKSFFGDVELYGQNQVTELRLRGAKAAAKMISSAWGVHFNQGLKLSQFIYDPSHAVELASEGVWEYLIAVCRRPLK